MEVGKKLYDKSAGEVWIGAGADTETVGIESQCGDRLETKAEREI